MRRSAAIAFVAVALTAAAPALAEDACADAMVEAQRLRSAGAYRRARERFGACAVVSCEETARQFCSDSLVDLDKQMPSVVFAARDAEGHDLSAVRVLVDGALVTTQIDGKPVVMDPGTKAVRFEAPPLPPVEVTIVVHAGEKSRTVRASFEGAPRMQRAMPLGGWLLVGIGAAALTGGAIFGVQGLRRISDHEAEPCAKTKSCDVSDVWRSFHTADILFGVSALAFGGALVAYLTSAAPAPVAKGAALRTVPTAGVGGAGLTLIGRF